MLASMKAPGMVTPPSTWPVLWDAAGCGVGLTSSAFVGAERTGVVRSARRLRHGKRPGREAGPAARFDEELMPAMMIYVGNLDYATTSEELRALFEPFGAVAMAEVQVKARTGQSRGFGLVDMPRQTEAEAAITALNNREFKD